VQSFGAVWAEGLSAFSVAARTSGALLNNRQSQARGMVLIAFACAGVRKPGSLWARQRNNGEGTCD
jgi:hypothetical protein